MNLTPEEIAAYLKRIEEQGDGMYSNLRMLEDGTVVGNYDLLFTRAVCIGMTEHESFERRYCYEDRRLATLACLALTTGDDEPLPGFIASRSR